MISFGSITKDYSNKPIKIRIIYTRLGLFIESDSYISTQHSKLPCFLSVPIDCTDIYDMIILHCKHAGVPLSLIFLS